MDVQHVDILLRLIIAHLLADFLLQSDTMANEKRKGLISLYFWMHILIVGLVTYLMLGQWSNWKGPLIIMTIHGVIDATKASIEKTEKKKSNKSKWLFVIDQFLHLVTLFAFWIITFRVTRNWDVLLSSLDQKLFNNTDLLIVMIAYLVITMPIGILIGFVTKKWQDEIKVDDRIRRLYRKTPVPKTESLKDAGKTIGMIERTLILTFILLNQYQAIGFLIAAKSVFRFGDLKESGQRKRTEYILIGTLISFFISIVIGILTLYLIEKL